MRIDVLGRTIMTHCGATRPKIGDAVKVALRPEAIEMTREDENDAMAATVISSTFLGDKIEYVVRCDGHALQISRYNAGPALPLAEGTRVSLSFADEAAVVLPQDLPQSGAVR